MKLLGGPSFDRSFSFRGWKSPGSTRSPPRSPSLSLLEFCRLRAKEWRPRHSLRDKLLRLKSGSGLLEMSKQTHITRSMTVSTTHICSYIGLLTFGHIFFLSLTQRTSCAHSNSILKPYLPGEQYLLQKPYHLCRPFAYSYDNCLALILLDLHTANLSYSRHHNNNHGHQASIFCSTW